MSKRYPFGSIINDKSQVGGNVGLYTIDCIKCKKSFQWFSSNPIQICGDCLTPAVQKAVKSLYEKMMKDEEVIKSLQKNSEWKGIEAQLDELNEREVYGINIHPKPFDVEVWCGCKNCGNDWSEMIYNTYAVKNSQHMYDYCSKCYKGDNE